MVQVVLVNKTGELTSANITALDMLYKKAGFKKVEGFEERHSWPVKVNGESCFVTV